ncbi:MAG TPA: hypothetical protein DCL35_06780 [Candidatus Omnitrophica bacterium]|nr:hypothetical protein [Candidatus Omnitrophota bacterium]
MNPETLKNAVELSRSVGHVLVATSGAKGLPHVAAAGRCELAGEDTVGVSEWFCPGTLENLEENRQVSIVIWDVNKDAGYQLLGVALDVEDVGVLDNFAGDKEPKRALPQVERRIIVKVGKITDFKNAPHSDIEG